MKFWDNESKKRIGILAGVLAALALSFSAGRWFAPEPEIKYHLDTKIEYRERVVEVEKKVEVVKEVRVRDEVVKWKEKIVEVKAPDGTTTTTTERVVDTDTHDSVKSDTSTTEEKKKETEVAAKETVKEDFQQTPAQAQWRAGAIVWLNIPTITLQNGLTEIPKSVIYGVQVEKRLLGGIWLGAQGTTAGTASLTLSLEF